MKITFICNKVTGRGGTETVLVKVLNELKKRNYNDIKLILSNLTEDDTWLKRIDHRIPYKYPQNDSRLGRLIFFTKVFHNADDNEIFIILSPNLVKYFAILKKVFHKRVKVVSWIHFSLINQDFFNPTVLLSADYHLAISSAIKNQLMSMGVPEKKIFLIFNPADKHEPLTHNSSDNKKHLLYIGRIQYDGQKNLKELFGGLKEASKNIVLDVFGSGKDLDICKENCRKLGIQDRVIWHGWSNNVWKDIDFQPFSIILTSKFEGLPMVFLEAMSRGIPCISSNFDGYDDIIIENKNGVSYCKGNSLELSKAINSMSKSHYQNFGVQKSIDKFYNKEYYSRLERVLNDINKW